MITRATIAYLGGHGTEDDPELYEEAYGTREQQQLFQNAAERIDELIRQAYPDADRQEMSVLSEDQYVGAAQYALGDATLEELGREVARTQLAYERALDTLQGAIVAASVEGLPETTIAARAGVSRSTVRNRLGK